MNTDTSTRRPGSDRTRRRNSSLGPTSLRICCVLRIECRCSTTRKAAPSPKPSCKRTGTPTALSKPKGALPHAPLVILVHMASVWVPYTSEAKEAIAPYPEIVKEIRLGLQRCGRRLAAHLHHETRVKEEFDKRTHLEKYLPHIGLALQQILELSDDERERMIVRLDNVLQEKRSM